MRSTTRAALCGALMLAAIGSFAAGAPASMKDGMLVDTKGMTLYTFDRDTAGKSACNGDCTGKWPPLVAAAGDEASGDFSIVTRDDGRKQWAYKGKPLYTWAADKAPGDKSGDNINNVWHVAK